MNANPRWERIQRLFHQALEVDATRRSQFLADACGDDTALYEEVQSLLAADHEDPPWFDRPVFEAASLMLSREPEGRSLVGERIGRYRVLAPLGAGGMGEVFLVERADGQYEHRAALKIVHRGTSSDLLSDSFRQERQIVASLDHPNIARLIDGGVTDNGRPYLVMEQVEGEPIDSYCARLDLSRRQRVELLRKVCVAVEHAHRQLVVHCDLKPSNILVNQAGEPKLLDFGVARLLGTGPVPRLEGRARDAPPMLTPAFASPEQLRGERPTTASDVYSLGVLLYLILTGEMPDLAGTARGSASAASDSSAAEAPRAPARPSAVEPACAGDLDAIVAKALAPSPEERYGSVEQLADDLDRHLRFHPVAARRSTMGYRANRFLRRHWIGTAAVTVAAAALLIGTIVSLRLWQLAERRGRAAEQAWEQAEASLAVVGDVFRQLDPSRTRDPDLRVKDLLGELASRVQEEPRQWPSLLQLLGDAYLNLGMTADAEESLLAALALRRARFGEPHLQVAETLNSLGLLYRETGQLDLAESYILDSLAMRRELAGQAAARERDLAEADSLNSVALLRWDQGDPAAAVEAERRSLELRRAHPQSDPRGLSVSLNNLGVLLLEGAEPRDAEPYLSEALKLRSDLYGARHLLVANTLNNLGRVQEETGNLPAAAERYRQALDIYRERFPQGHPSLAAALTNLAGVLGESEPDRALQLLDEAIAIYQQMDRPTKLADAFERRGQIEYANGRNEVAKESFGRALELREEHQGAAHPAVVSTLVNLAWVHLARQELPALRPRVRVVLSAVEAANDAPPAHRAVLRGLLGLTLAAGGEREEGARLLSAARRELEQLGDEDYKLLLHQMAWYIRPPLDGGSAD